MYMMFIRILIGINKIMQVFKFKKKIVKCNITLALSYQIDEWIIVMVVKTNV